MVLFIIVLSMTIGPASRLVKYAYAQKDIYDLSLALSQYGIKGNIAADNRAWNDWHKTLYICFHLNLKFYGIPKPGEPFAELVDDFKKYDIDYFFVWGDGNLSLLSAKYREITGNRIAGLKIFKLKS